MQKAFLGPEIDFLQPDHTTQVTAAGFADFRKAYSMVSVFRQRRPVEFATTCHIGFGASARQMIIDERVAVAFPARRDIHLQRSLQPPTDLF